MAKDKSWIGQRKAARSKRLNGKKLAPLTVGGTFVVYPISKHHRAHIANTVGYVDAATAGLHRVSARKRT